MYAEWIKAGLRKPGKSAIGLAQYLTKTLKLKRPMHRITIHKMTYPPSRKGARKVHSVELAPIAAYLEEPIPGIPTAAARGELVSIKIVSEVCAGVWMESISTAPIGTIVATRDFQFPNSELTAYAFKGDSMLNVGIIDGDVLICIPPKDDEIVEGRQVIIERNRAGLIERSARIVAKWHDRIEYVTASSNDLYKPCVVYKKKKIGHGSENETVRVVAIIRRVTRNIP